MISIKTVQLLWVSHSQLLPGSVIKSHSHEYYHLLCVHSGAMPFVLDEHVRQLTAGDLVIVPKDHQHSFRNDTQQPVRYYEIKFTVLNSALDKALLSCDPFAHQDTLAFSLVEHIANEYLCHRSMTDVSASTALSTLVFHLTADSRLIDDQEPEVIDTTGFSKLAKNVISYLTAHYGENLTLDEISAGVDTTKNYLCNAFKRSTGITILECLNLIRIRKAAELIVYSDLSLAQVAQMCGYVSVSHFNRLFSHYIGIPPGQCRRAYSFDLVSGDRPTTHHSDSFMYSVLAGKSISPATINEFETSKTENA